jgi:hypothetical protein
VDEELAPAAPLTDDWPLGDVAVLLTEYSGAELGDGDAAVEDGVTDGLL